MSDHEVIWEQEDLQVWRRECQEPDSFKYEYTLGASDGFHDIRWTQNPQEFGIQGRSYLATTKARTEFTMFIKNERYFNHYGVRL